VSWTPSTQLTLRYILQMNVMDYTSSFWVTAFNEVAEQLLGISANDLMRFKEEGDPQFEKYMTKAQGKTWTFQMMAKQDTFNVSRPLVLLLDKLTNRTRSACATSAAALPPSTLWPTTPISSPRSRPLLCSVSGI
jgi:replication factor A1